MSADSLPSSKTNIFQSKLIYCGHFRTYSRCAMFDWSDTVFRRKNVTRRRISNTVLQPRYWGREADSPEVCRLNLDYDITFYYLIISTIIVSKNKLNSEHTLIKYNVCPCQNIQHCSPLSAQKLNKIVNGRTLNKHNMSSSSWSSS
jgi:hypothetical protein